MGCEHYIYNTFSCQDGGQCNGERYNNSKLCMHGRADFPTNDIMVMVASQAHRQRDIPKPVGTHYNSVYGIRTAYVWRT